jgi:hypothetical protein
MSAQPTNQAVPADGLSNVKCTAGPGAGGGNLPALGSQ